MTKVRQRYKDYMHTRADGVKFSDQEDVGRYLVDSAREVREHMENFYGEVQGLYQRELDYGLRLGLSAAKEAKRRDDQKKKIEPVKPGDWPPRPAPPPSRGPGSDDDYLGDGWRLEGSGEKRGWKSMTDGGWKP